MVPTDQGRIDRVGVGAGAVVGPESGAHQRQPGLSLRVGGLLDGRARGPPARPVLDTRGGVEDGDGAPAEPEADVDLGASSRRTVSAASMAAPTLG